MARKLQVLGSTKRELTSELLFTEVFLAHYPPGVSLEQVRRTDANPANNPEILRALDDTAQVFSALADQALDQALELDGSDASIHRLSRALTAEQRDRLYERMHGGERLLLLFVAHAAVYIGKAIVKNHGGQWLVRNPLWETRVLLSSRAGRAELCPFSWLLRALSDPPKGVTASSATTLADRYRTLVEVPCLTAAEWPVIAPKDRKLPRLGRVRYDLLYQHLKTHLPELTDFGEDFPSPERFAEMAFQSLTFTVVGEGRALLLCGAGKGGVHLIWMSNQGFSKSVFVEADAVPEPFVRTFNKETEAGAVECVRLTFSKNGEAKEFESLWWGP